MTVLAENNQFYNAIFLGTIQHSLSYTRTPIIKVGLSLNGELLAVKTIKISDALLNNHIKLGDSIELGTIKGNILDGYTAIPDNIVITDSEHYADLFQNLEKVKNVSQLKLMKETTTGKNDENNLKDFVKAPTTSGSQIKHIRILFGLTQTKFSQITGISVGHLSNIENEKCHVTKEVITKMNTAFPDLHYPIDLQFDWVTITFSDMTGKDVIHDILKMNSELFLERQTAQNFYTRELAFGGEKNIYIQDFEPISDANTGKKTQKRGTTLYLTGQGTRLFEKALLEQGSNWKLFFANTRRYRGSISRLDTALNDCFGLLDMNEIIAATMKKRFWSRTRKYAIHGSNAHGWTATFGNSSLTIRIYDKQREQELKGLQTIVKNRVEVELHGNKAEQVMTEWLENDNLMEYVISILYTYLWFVDEEIDSKKLSGTRVRERYIDNLKPMAGWYLLTSLGKPMRFVNEGHELTIDHTLNWITNYVAPALAVLKKTGHWPVLIDAMDKVNLSPAQEKMIKENVVENTKN